MTKAERIKELLQSCIEQFEHIDSVNNNPTLNTTESLIMKIKEAINYTRCCESDSELLSKRPNTSSTWECFTKADKQKKTTINIGDLIRYCISSIEEFPMLEKPIRSIYIDAVDDIVKGENEDRTCQNAIMYIEGEIQDIL